MLFSIYMLQQVSATAKRALCCSMRTCTAMSESRQSNHSRLPYMDGRLAFGLKRQDHTKLSLPAFILCLRRPFPVTSLKGRRPQPWLVPVVFKGASGCISINIAASQRSLSSPPHQKLPRSSVFTLTKPNLSILRTTTSCAPQPSSRRPS
jgi:hypothetical protein